MIKQVQFRVRAKQEMKCYQRHNKILYEKVISLIEDIKRHPYTGIGKPEALKFELTGFWSRRITQKHRLVYRIEGDTIIIIASCMSHYQ